MEQFITDVKAYAAACGLKPTTVVQRAAGVSGAAWGRWEAGGSCTLATADKVRAFMRANPAQPPQSDPAPDASAANSEKDAA